LDKPRNENEEKGRGEERAKESRSWFAEYSCPVHQDIGRRSVKDRGWSSHPPNSTGNTHHDKRRDKKNGNRKADDDQHNGHEEKTCEDEPGEESHS
jgi:hypothetical protein